MEQLPIRKVKGDKIDTYQREGYKIFVQHAVDWEGPCFHLHIDITDKFCKSMYEDMIDSFEEIMFQYYERPMKTVLMPDADQIKLAKRFGFQLVDVFENGWLYFEWVEDR